MQSAGDREGRPYRVHGKKCGAGGITDVPVAADKISTLLYGGRPNFLTAGLCSAHRRASDSRPLSWPPIGHFLEIASLILPQVAFGDFPLSPPAALGSSLTGAGSPRNDRFLARSVEKQGVQEAAPYGA